MTPPGPLLAHVSWDFPDPAADGGVGFAYDDQLQIGGTAVDGFSPDVCFRYDLDGSLAGVGEGTIVDGVVTSCTELMTLVRDPQTGQLESSALDIEAVETTYGYNGFGELSSLDTLLDGDPEFQFLLEYDSPPTIERDALGRITYTREVEGRACAADTDCWAGGTCAAGVCQMGGLDGKVIERWYTYDDYDRLEAIWDQTPPSGPDCSADPPQVGLLGCWEYDANGNRLVARDCSGGPTPDCTATGPAVVDGQDRLLEYGDLEFEYDERGSLVTRIDNTTDAEEERCYTYDTFGNLRQVEIGAPGLCGSGGGVTPDTTIVYDVDTMNRRVGRTVTGVGATPTTRWIYRDQLNPIAELDDDGDVVTRFVYGTRGHVPDYMYRLEGANWVLYRFLTDHLGAYVGW